MRPGDFGLDSLWTIPAALIPAVDSLERQALPKMKPEELEQFFVEHGLEDLFPCWTPGQVEASRTEGKIPDLRTWQALLDDGTIGLDSLMNLAGLNSFRQDQREMDDRVRQLIGQSGG